MSSISSLLQALPKVSQSRMIGSGYGVWLVWGGSLNTAVPHTLKDYGAIPMAQSEGQALWLSPTPEIFRALARLQIWARLNPMPLFCQVVPVTVLVGYDLTLSMALPSELGKQVVDAPKEFEVWVHPKLGEALQHISGLSMQQKGAMAGLANADWRLFDADEGLDYETLLNWFFVIKPVGRMGEKDSIMGWRAWADEIKKLFGRLSIKYLVGTREEVLIFSIKGLRSLRGFISESLKLIAETKNQPDRSYWPCVMAAVGQKGKQFTEEIIHKFNLDWNKLTPDLPHLSYRDAFMLGDGFKVNEARYGGDESLESWCNVGLAADAGEVSKSAAEIILPRKLMALRHDEECFYCGLRSHKSGECPSRWLSAPKPGVWSALARVDIKEFPVGMRKLDDALDEQDTLGSLTSLLGSEKKIENLMAAAMFEINSAAQFRILERVWRSRGKEWPSGLKQLVPEEGQFVNEAMEAFKARDYERTALLLKQLRLKYARSYIPSSLQGFLAMEENDQHQARFYWQEAERLSYTPLQQGYFAFLQARSLEVEGEYKEAATLYRRAYMASPKWLDTLYRGGVCMVKLGFTGQAIDMFNDLWQQDPNFFNQALIDPELDRGRAHVLSAMWDRWAAAESEVEGERERVEKLDAEIEQRFSEDHDFYEPAKKTLEHMKALAKLNNFVAFLELISALAQFDSKLSRQVEQDIKRMQSKVEYLVERLKDVQQEASWFPFPKLLREFNRDFNYCVEKINWVNHQHIKAADNFRQAAKFLSEVEERLTSLQSRLVTLRIIRDSTLFILMLGRSFIWFEVIGLGLGLVGLPLAIYFTRSMENIWLVDVIREQQWEFQKGLILILSVLALVVSLLKTAISFERRKKELFERPEEEGKRGGKGGANTRSKSAAKPKPKSRK
ncbi:MAG: tol-pal system YbgF family protein [Desulfovibrio sp.]